jgi:ribosomal silencing factor RsfS
VPRLGPVLQLQEFREGAWVLVDVDAQVIEAFQAERR